MEKFTQFIIKNNKSIILIFLIITVICWILAISVKVNYNLEDYLPKDSNSTIGLNIMKDEFDEDFPSANVMLLDVSIRQALECKGKLKNIPHVTSFIWLDDIIGLDVLLSTPIEYTDSPATQAYYKNNNALISLAIEPGYEQDAVNKLHKIIGEDNALSGSSVNKAVLQEMSSYET